jgi:hypothetical protein
MKRREAHKGSNRENTDYTELNVGSNIKVNEKNMKRNVWQNSLNIRTGIKGRVLFKGSAIR